MNWYINIISNWTWQWMIKIDSDSILQSQDLGTAFQALERFYKLKANSTSPYNRK